MACPVPSHPGVGHLLSPKVHKIYTLRATLFNHNHSDSKLLVQDPYLVTGKLEHKTHIEQICLSLA